MVVTESFGGTCPICSYKRMLMRYGSTGWFQFDACPRCGFAYGNNQCDDDWSAEQIWDAIIGANHNELKRIGFPLTIEGVLMWMESLPPPQEDRDTVFTYNEKYINKFKKRYKKHGSCLKGAPITREKVVFT